MDQISVAQTEAPQAPQAPETSPTTDAPVTADAAATTSTDAAAADAATSEATGGETPADATSNDATSDADTGTLTETEAGPDALAQLGDDQSAFILGALPLILLLGMTIAILGVYLVRRRKNWHELDDALKIDGGDTPIGDEAFTTRDMQEMGATRPSQRVSDLNK